MPYPVLIDTIRAIDEIFIRLAETGCDQPGDGLVFPPVRCDGKAEAAAPAVVLVTWR
jgi:hypothetical protein